MDFAHDGMRYDYATFMETMAVIKIIVFGIPVLSGLLAIVFRKILCRYTCK